MAKHTAKELQELQALPLEAKVSLTMDRIEEWVEHFGVDGVYVSFSGGKDSTVLLDICRKMYPEIKACFIDTGLEYPEIREFVKGFDNVDIVKPKMNFKQVIQKYGYPFISKEASEIIEGARKCLKDLVEDGTLLELDGGIPGIEQIVQKKKPRYFKWLMNLTGTGCYKYKAKKKVFPSDEEIFAEILNKKLKNREGGSNQRLALILGIMAQNGEIVADPSGNRSKFSQKKYKFMLDCPYEVSNKCCRVMKKEPGKRYEKETGRKPITGQMASESRMRYQRWMQDGCNAFDNKKQVSNPMSFWNDSDVLEYCKVNNIKLASVYGDIVEKHTEGENQISMFDEPGGKKEYTTTGCKRTGCMFCGFGCHLEDSPNRFEMLKETHPNIYEWIMSEQGLDYRNLINWLNEHGDMNIKY